MSASVSTIFVTHKKSKSDTAINPTRNVCLSKTCPVLRFVFPHQQQREGVMGRILFVHKQNPYRPVRSAAESIQKLAQTVNGWLPCETTTAYFRRFDPTGLVLSRRGSAKTNAHWVLTYSWPLNPHAVEGLWRMRYRVTVCFFFFASQLYHVRLSILPLFA